MTDHDWTTVVRLVGSAGSTDTVEQCRACGIVRHSYCYATLERQLSTERYFDTGIEVRARDCVDPAPDTLTELPAPRPSGAC